MDMRFIGEETLPRWYGLSWLKDEKAIVLTVHPSMRQLLECIRKDSPIVEHVQKEFEFKEFVGGLGGETFGFDGCLELKAGNDTIQLLIRLPKIRVETSEKCRDCQGTTRYEILDDECFLCRGTGKEWKYEWQKAYAISVTLNLLLSQMEFPEQFPKNPKSQLLTVRLHTAKGQHGGELCGIYGIPVTRWLTRKGQNFQINQMTVAMTSAYRQMLGEPSFIDRFRASIDHPNGWLNVDCPGDACGLHPSDHGFKPNEGYEFNSHNVDTPAQQLTLLAGLAALHDLVDEEIYELT